MKLATARGCDLAAQLWLDHGVTAVNISTSGSLDVDS